MTTGQSPLIDQQVQGTSFSPGTPLNIGDSYRWWVRAQTSTNVSGFWSATGSFTIQQLAAPSLSAPGGEQTSQEPTFTWNAVAGADHYEIWVGDLTTGQQPVLHNQDVTGTSFTAGTALVPGDDYRWWVRAITSTGADGFWSNPLEFSEV